MFLNKILYDFLGVDTNASQEQIKLAYRKNVKRFYPSHDTGLESIKDKNFQSMSDAYSILNDPEKRKLYDQYGLTINTQKKSDDNHFFNIFGNFDFDFTPKYKTDDINHVINVTLEDLYKGKEVNLLIRRNIICLECKGNQYNETCKVCSKCHGEKLIEEKKIITVNIEPGMEDGEKITFYGCSDEDLYKETGNFVVCLHQVDHPVFKRKKDNLLMTKKINLYDALAGSKIKIDLLDGRSVLLAPDPNEIIKKDSAIKIEHEGMQKRNDISEKGDLFIKFEVEFPTKSQISPQLLNELRKCFPPSNDEDDPNIINQKDIQQAEMINSNINEFDLN